MMIKPQPGIYTIPVRVSSDGTLTFNLEAIRPQRSEPTPPNKIDHLQDFWNDSVLNYEVFISELERLGYLDGNRLLMNGPMLKGLFFALLKIKALPSLSMRKVYKLLTSEFELSIKNYRSLNGKSETWVQHQEQWHVILSHVSHFRNGNVKTRLTTSDENIFTS